MTLFAAHSWDFGRRGCEAAGEARRRVSAPFVRLALTVILCIGGGRALRGEDTEVNLADADYKKMDPFEARSIGRADTVFKDREYRRAVAEYDSFMKEFPKSAAIPYAIMRKGRAMQWDNKRHEAIKIYNEVMDFFPDAVEYASPTLFYIGECHWGNGLKDEALKVWKELANDQDYRKHRLAAYAINSLAGRLLEDGQYADAAKYYLQVAVDFRGDNRNASGQAIRQLFLIHVRIRPDVRKLREACKVLQGFEWPPRRELAEDDVYFWAKVRGLVREFGSFSGQDADRQAVAHYGFWADVMKGGRPEDDDFQKDYSDFQFYADKKENKWMERLDAQFDKYQKPNDYDRVAKWILFYSRHPKKVDFYYAKLNFPKMRNSTIKSLVFGLFDTESREAAKIIYFKLKFNEMKDPEKVEVARFFWYRDENLVVDMCGRIDDKDLGAMEQLRFWEVYQGDAKKKAGRGLPLADHCCGVPVYARESYWIKGGLFRKINKMEEAIQAYQMTDDPPKSLYAITDCLVALGRIDAAVQQLREIENFFVDESSRASLEIAHVYRGAGRQDQYVAELASVLKKYPRSRESSRAHRELEGMGRSDIIRGGLDAD